MGEDLARTPISMVDQRAPIQAPKDMAMSQVLLLMQRHHRSAVVVVDWEGRFAGMFSEGDALLKLAAARARWADPPVWEFAVKDVLTARPTDTIRSVLNAMKGHDYRYMPVVDAERKPTAIIAIRDIVAYVAEFFPQEVL